jgi:hypothetical protein
MPKMTNETASDYKHTMPDVVAPEQFVRLWHTSRVIPPAQRLALAVLWQAVLDLRKFRFAKRQREQRLYMDAYTWVNEDDGSAYSFRRLCEVFNVEPDEARRVLLSLATPPTDGSGPHAEHQRVDQAA